MSPSTPRQAWLLECGHKFELNLWQQTLTDRGEAPDSAECNFCGKRSEIEHVVDRPGQGEYKLGDKVQIVETDEGLYRWERRGKVGELVDVSVDFQYERDALTDAFGSNQDAFDRR